MSDGEKLVLASLQDGWTSFRRAAFPLMASALLMAGLLLARQCAAGNGPDSPLLSANRLLPFIPT